MLVRGIDDVFVNLVGDDVAVVSDHNVGYLLQLLAGKDLATGVRRVAKHQSLGSLPKSIFNQVGIKRKSWRHQRDIDRLSSCENRISGIVLVERREDSHPVTRVHHSHHRRHHCLR